MNRLLLPLAVILSTAALHAENWSNWRGPLHGSSPEQGLPATFSKTEGVKWAVEMPGMSAATPVIWGDRVFATAADAKTGKQAALCLDRRTGARRSALTHRSCRSACVMAEANPCSATGMAQPATKVPIFPGNAVNFSGETRRSGVAERIRKPDDSKEKVVRRFPTQSYG